MDMLVDAGFQREAIAEYYNRREAVIGPALWQGHTWVNSFDACKEHMAAGMPTIVPLRHPKVVAAISWMMRDREPLENLFKEFDKLIELDQYHPYYIPIDNEAKRGPALARINQELKLGLSTKWEPTEECGNSRLRHTMVGSTKPINLGCERIRSFLDRFY